MSKQLNQLIAVMIEFLLSGKPKLHIHLISDNKIPDKNKIDQNAFILYQMCLDNKSCDSYKSSLLTYFKTKDSLMGEYFDITIQDYIIEITIKKGKH